MGLFKKKPQQRAVQPREPLTVSIDAYPSATAEQRESMSGLLAALDAKRGAGGFEPQQCAAISTLCERLTDENPALGGFVAELRAVAEGEMQAGNSDMSWRWLATKL